MGHQFVNLGPAVDDEEGSEDGDDTQQFSHPDLDTEENHRDDEEEDGEEEMEDKPVEQEPPLPLVDTDNEKKVDEDSETHSDDDTRYLQPIDCYDQCQNHVSNCCFLHVKQLGKTVGIRDLPRVKKPDVHG